MRVFLERLLIIGIFFGLIGFFFWILPSENTNNSQKNPLEIGRLDSYINDRASILTVEQKNALEERAKSFATSSWGYQIVSVLFPNRNGNELADIGLKIFRENKIGDAKKNDGILLLIATEEKKIRIVTGYGAEWFLPDIAASKIVENVRPLLNDGKYFEAVSEVYDGIAGQNASTKISNTTSSKTTSWSTFQFSLNSKEGTIKTNGEPLDSSNVFIFIILFIGIITFITLFGKGGKWGNGGFSSGTFSSSSGGGGFSWGGGSSGGGGAGD